MDIMRTSMDAVHEAQADYTHQYASDPIPFQGPHHGVYVRRWKNADGWGNPGISIECDPGYCGIGTALTPDEARGLAGALLRAADAAETHKA